MKKYVKVIIETTVKKDFISKRLNCIDKNTFAEWIVEEIISQVEQEDIETDKQLNDINTEIVYAMLANTLGVSIASAKKEYKKDFN